MATTPRSYEQRLGDLLNAVFAKTHLSGLRVGGPFLSMLEGVAASGTKDASDVFDALNASDPTRLRGEQLDRYGRSKGVRRPDAVAAKTEVTIGDSSFTKISSRLSPLVSPPIPGQTTLRVADATAFPASGQIYIGRGTTSYEGPIAYSAKVNNGSDWTLTLSAAVARRHNGSEDVVLAQGGNRPIPAGTTIQTQQGNALAAASFNTLFATSLPDGETEIVGVEVLCSQRGEVGNVPAGAITSFPSPPFAGATATNPRRVTTGRNVTLDPEYLQLIQLAEASRSKGTPLALRQAALQVTAPDEPATANILTGIAAMTSPNTTWEYNVEKGKEILEAAGWVMDGDTRKKDGVELKVTYSTSINSVRQKSQAIIKQALEEMGFNVELRQVDSGIFFDGSPGNEQNINHFYNDMQQYTNNATTPIPVAYMIGWYAGPDGENIAQASNNWNGQNYGRYQSAEYDDLFEMVRLETDINKAAEMFIQLNDILINDVAVVPLVNRAAGKSAISNELVAGNIGLSDFEVDYWNIANWVTQG